MAEVKIKLIEGMKFEATTGSRHSIIIDAAQDKGGTDAGARPMEMLLVALGGCTGMDVIYILRKMRVEAKGFEIEIKGELADEHPKVYKNVTLTYIFYGKDIPENKVKEAIELSQTKYCSVSATMKTVGQVTYKYKIISNNV